MDGLDLQSLGMRLGEAITPTPRDAPQVRYGTIDAVNANGTLDVTIDGTTLRGMCATTGCVGASAGMRCVVLRQGALATVVGLVANTDLAGITIGGTLDAGGITYGGAAPMVDASDTTAVSKASGTWSSRASITLDAGVWVIIAACQFASNATGRRGINLSTTSGSTSTSAAAAAVVAAANGMQTVVSRSWVQTLTGSTTYHMNVYQNSGAALDTSAYLRAVRVA